MPPSHRRSVKINKINCGQCKLAVEEEEENIECDKCEKLYHVLCTSLNKPQYEYLLKHEKEEYVCHLCDDKNSGTITCELNVIKTELKKLDQLNQLTAMRETMEFMSKQYDDILKGVAENKKKIDVIQKENKALKTEIKVLKDSVKFLNDQRVINDCVLTGVEYSESLTAVETVLKLTKEAGVEIQAENIEDAYFIKQKHDSKNKKQIVIVKMNSKKSKEKIMSIKKVLKENEATKSVFINDFLSKETLSLLNYAKTLKTIGYRRVYAASGRVFVKKSELSRPRIIRSEEDVDNLLLEASVQRRSRGSRMQREDSPDEEDNEEYASS